jgi:hypothetical protein
LILLSLSFSLCGQEPRKRSATSSEEGQTAYYYERPKPHWNPKNKNLVKVKIYVQEDPQPDGDKIASVQFDGKNIPLHSADPTGRRGVAHFQVPPGKHKVTWTIRKNKYAYPRSASFEKEIEIEDAEKWLDIHIEGDDIYISPR